MGQYEKGFASKIEFPVIVTMQPFVINHRKYAKIKVALFCILNHKSDKI